MAGLLPGKLKHMDMVWMSRTKGASGLLLVISTSDGDELTVLLLQPVSDVINNFHFPMLKILVIDINRHGRELLCTRVSILPISCTCLRSSTIVSTRYPADRIRKLFDVNVHGAFFCAREVARHMIERKIKGGSIILVSSMSANVRFFDRAPIKKKLK